MIGGMPKANVTIYLGASLLARVKAAAAEDNRSLSNYLEGLLDRAHPDPVHPSRQADLVDQLRAADKARGYPTLGTVPPRKTARHK